MLVRTNLPFLESMDHVLYRFFVELRRASSQAMLAYCLPPSFVHCVKSRMCRTVQVSASSTKTGALWCWCNRTHYTTPPFPRKLHCKDSNLNICFYELFVCLFCLFCFVLFCFVLFVCLFVCLSVTSPYNFTLLVGLLVRTCEKFQGARLNILLQ